MLNELNNKIEIKVPAFLLNPKNKNLYHEILIFCEKLIAYYY